MRKLDSHRPTTHIYYTDKFVNNSVLTSNQWRTEGGGWGGQTPPPEIRSFDKAEPDCKLSGKCFVFLFQHN